MSVVAPDFSKAIDDRQMAIPGLDGYVAEKLAVSLSGGVEFNDVTQADDVQFVKGLRLGQEVKLTVIATVVDKGYRLQLGRDEMTDDKMTYGVKVKVHSLEQV